MEVLMTVSFEGNRLIIDGNTVEFEQPIEDMVERRDRVIVVLDDEEYAPGDPTGDRNVVAVDRNGTLLWRIAPSMSTPGEAGEIDGP